MDLIKYLKSIELETENEESIISFLGTHENEIHSFIIELWQKYPTIEHVSAIVSIDESTDTKEIALLPEHHEHTDQDNLSEGNSDDINISFEQENIIKSDEQLKDSENKKQKQQNSDQSLKAYQIQINNKNIVIPNGKVGQEYKFKFNIEELAVPDIGDYWFEKIEELGINFDKESKVLSGKPALAGDHKINLKIKRNDWAEGKPIFERVITLIINPDPKSLWKNIPTPKNIEYYKPDSDKAFVKVLATGGKGKNGTVSEAKKDIVAASQRGRSHAQEGKPRDDDFGLRYDAKTDWYIMAVADGAGSAKNSRRGSQIACQVAIDVCNDYLKTTYMEFENLIENFHSNRSPENRKLAGDLFYTILGNAVYKAVKAIEEEAKSLAKPMKDYATTLIISVCKKFSFGWFVGAFWVGDGGIGIYNKDTRFLKILGESDGGEYAGQTRFLTMPEITQASELYRRLRFDIVDDFTALILMTDGITDPKFETDANLLKIEKWDNLWEDLSKEVDFSDDNEASADQLLNWLDFWSPGNHDDRTIAILF